MAQRTRLPHFRNVWRNLQLTTLPKKKKLYCHCLTPHHNSVAELYTFYWAHYWNGYNLSRPRLAEDFIGHQCLIKLTGLPYLSANPSFMHIFPYCYCTHVGGRILGKKTYQENIFWKSKCKIIKDRSGLGHNWGVDIQEQLSRNNLCWIHRIQWQKIVTNNITFKLVIFLHKNPPTASFLTTQVTDNRVFHNCR